MKTSPEQERLETELEILSTVALVALDTLSNHITRADPAECALAMHPLIALGKSLGRINRAAAKDRDPVGDPVESLIFTSAVQWEAERAAERAKW